MNRTVYLTLVCVLLLLLTGCSSMSVNELRTTYHVLNAADVGSTVYGLDHGCREANPVVNDKKDAILFGAAISGLAELICGNADNEEKACWIGFSWVKILTLGWNAHTLAGGCQ